MDGGEREKQMSERLKAMVRTKANLRRERRWATGISPDEPESAPANATDNDALSHRMASAMTLESGTEAESADTSGDSCYTPDTSTTTSPPNFAPDVGAAHATEATQGGGGGAVAQTSRLNATDYSDDDLGFSMMYLDHVLPYMVPFYRPPLIYGGRGWMLVLLMRNKALYHTALSLASYCFSLLLGSMSDGHEACRANGLKNLQKQQELSIKELHHSMRCLTASGGAENFQQSLQCLEAIIQLLAFESAISNMSNWQMHLDAATSLFEQMLEHHAKDPERPWYDILANLNQSIIDFEFPGGGRPWSSNQASLRFLTIHLVWNDILASTALSRAPRLQPYHAQLLGDGPLGTTRGELPAEEFLGCHNWVILCLADIAALAAWKREMRASGALSVIELVRRAAPIEARLRAGLVQLAAAVPADVPLMDPSATAPDQPFYGTAYEAVRPTAVVAAETSSDNCKTGCQNQVRTTPSQAFHTQVWALASLTYLSVVVSGFQPALPEIQSNVVATMELFRKMPGPLCLRTFSWPFAITGCLALASQEDFFRELVANMGTLEVFGTVREALQVMSAIWEHRNCLDAEMWDIAACLNVLGHRSLLV